MDRLFQDLIVSFRRLRSSPGFTIAAILTLALGIGANTTIFSLVNAVVFRPFGVERQNELVFFNMHLAKGEFPATSYPDYKDYRDRNTVLSGLAMYRFIAMNLSRGENKMFVCGATRSAEITSTCWASNPSGAACCIPRTT